MSKEIAGIHKRENCKPPCPFHAPSDHHMVSWKKMIRMGGIVERLCPEHGVGHPDPDSLKFHYPNISHVHGCCGCCRPPDKKESK